MEENTGSVCGDVTALTFIAQAYSEQLQWALSFLGPLIRRDHERLTAGIVVKLTPRERQIVHPLLKRLARQEDCGRISISFKTVKTHFSHIYVRNGIAGGVTQVKLAVMGYREEQSEWRMEANVVRAGDRDSTTACCVRRRKRCACLGIIGCLGLSGGSLSHEARNRFSEQLLAHRHPQYLMMHHGNAAAAEFQKFTTHEREGPQATALQLAHLSLTAVQGFYELAFRRDCQALVIKKTVDLEVERLRREPSTLRRHWRHG